ncbi:MAG: response regulator [Defluviitaleaceae bacterium]|nr:response regulator [Defluviitaleaceae bacterium]
MITKLATAKQHLNVSADKPNLILWVDDYPDNNIYPRKVLEVIGFSFELALSTQEAMSRFSTGKYAAIISDMGRAEGTREGYVLLEEIRKLDGNIPYFIYAVSGTNSREKLKRETERRGAQGTTDIAEELIEMIITHVQVS